MNKDIKVENQKEMIRLMASTYFPNGAVDAFNSINLMNVFTKLKIPNKNEIIGFCVKYPEIPYIYDANNKNPSMVLYESNNLE